MEKAVAIFMKRYTFHCQAMNVFITPEECRERQRREVETTYFGRRVVLNNTPADRYCRSGCCSQGLVHLKRLDPRLHRQRAAEVKRRDEPCHRLRMGSSDAPAWVGQ